MNERKCKVCSSITDETQLKTNSYICPICGHYFSYNSLCRIRDLSDNNQFKKLEFCKGYYEKIADKKYRADIRAVQERCGLSEAIVCGETRIAGISVLVGVMDSRFMMASMGHVVGESICQLFKRAIKKRLPVVLFCCSGGARMQEGIISLMQMEKTAAIVKKHNDAGLLYISVLTNPTMGGVTASFAMLADIVLAEKGAMIGFAGARVIEQNTGEKLPEGFQSAEFQKEHGFVDSVIERNEMKETLSYLLSLHILRHSSQPLEIGLFKMEEPVQDRLLKRSPWEQVQIARNRNRPTSLDYINILFSNFYELSGDRVDGDDHAVVAGIATFHGIPITVIGQQKGKTDIQEARFRNFGMPSPSGYRKALRLAKQAEKFRRPIIFFTDTIGAACGAEAECKGQGLAIATMLYEMSSIGVPVYSIIIGEGGSGGALAFAIGNEVDILENAVYSVITPEGYASIVWKDRKKAAEAADIMKLTSEELYEMQVVDKIIPEYAPLTFYNLEQVCDDISISLYSFLERYRRKSKKRIAKDRYKRFAKY